MIEEEQVETYKLAMMGLLAKIGIRKGAPFKPSAELEKIYTHVHFLPGVPDAPSAARKDGKSSLLNTTPNSPRSQIIFGQALASESVHQIGIATHMYFDTWAHQNFIGTTYHFNGMRDPKNIIKSAGKKALPNVGHADAKHDPDIITLKWTDDRLVNSKISNRQRHLDAGQHRHPDHQRYRRHV